MNRHSYHVSFTPLHSFGLLPYLHKALYCSTKPVHNVVSVSAVCKTQQHELHVLLDLIASDPTRTPSCIRILYSELDSESFRSDIQSFAPFSGLHVLDLDPLPPSQAAV